MASRMMNRGLLVANLFLLVLAFQWPASDAGRYMAAPNTPSTTHELGDDTQTPRFSTERKLAAYDYTRDSAASWDESFSSESSVTTGGTDDAGNDSEEFYIYSPETVQSSDPNADDVFLDTSSAETVYSAAETDS
jgi:hypothetical protein